MKYGDDIKMVRDYDRHRTGQTLVAGRDVSMGVARALCAGDEPYAKRVDDDEPDEDK